MSQRSAVKYGSLFSGIGGFDLGFEQSGLSCQWQVEIDKDCHKVLEARFPNVPKHTDVKGVGKLPTVDVICGGFPCQDLSVAGKRAGLAGERSGLWFEFLRIVGLNRPRFVVIENVPGLLSSDEGRDFAVILRGLVECGYCLAWRIVDAQFYGVAQRRRRVFIVGSLGDGSCAEILFESESVSWNPPTRREAGQRVAGVAETSPTLGSSNFKPTKSTSGAQIDLCIPILEAGARTNGDGHRDGDGIGAEGDPMFTLQRGKQHAVAHALSCEGADASEDGTGRGTPLVVANCFNGYTGGADDNDAQANHLIAFEPHHDEHEGRGVNFKEAETNPALRGPNGTDNTLIAFAQNTRDEVRIQGDGKISGALSNQPGMKQQTYIAFSSKDHGADAGEIAAPTLRSQHFKDSHMNGGGQVAIAFRACGQDGFTPSEEVTPPIASTDGGGANAPTIAFTERTRTEGRTFEAQEELAYAITNPGSGGRTHSRQVAGQFGVRRLTPRECERLQGFPDDFTRYDASGKEISDSARYRMLGNAVAVTVSRWLGQRLAQFA